LCKIDSLPGGQGKERVEWRRERAGSEDIDAITVVTVMRAGSAMPNLDADNTEQADSTRLSRKESAIICLIRVIRVLIFRIFGIPGRVQGNREL
jgi:hypothetical protein